MSEKENKTTNDTKVENNQLDDLVNKTSEKENKTTNDTKVEQEYVVIWPFVDKDTKQDYSIGNIFPANGQKLPNVKRLQELLSDKNAVGEQLIKEVK